MWRFNTISKKKRSGSVKCKVSVKNVGNVAGTLTATPVEGEAEEIELGAGDTYILLKEVEKGKNLNTVYSSVEVVYDESHEWEMVVSQVVNADVLANANITYVATFDTDGGSTVADQNVPYGSKVTRPADPTKQDKVFAGWYTTDALTTAFDFDTVITDDTTIYAKWEDPAPTYTITIHNEDAEESCTLTATPVEGQAETYTVASGSSQVLAQEVEEGDAISTVYSSIVANFGDVPRTIDVSTVMNENKTFNVSIPHPVLSSTVRILNNSTTLPLEYTATPTDVEKQEETGTIQPGESAELQLGVRTGDAISSQYSGIYVYYPDYDIERWLDTSAVAEGETYIDLVATDMTYPIIRNASTAQTATIHLETDAITNTVEIAPGESFTLPEPVRLDENIDSVYHTLEYTYPETSGTFTHLQGEKTSEYPFVISDEVIIAISNSAPYECALEAVKVDENTETHTINEGELLELDEKIGLGRDINTVYTSITCRYQTGTLVYDTTVSMNAPYNGYYNLEANTNIVLGYANESSSNKLMISYIPHGDSETTTLEVEPGYEQIDYSGPSMQLGDELNTAYSDFKYSFDNGATWTQLDLTQRVTRTTDEMKYIIKFNNI